MSTAAEPAVQRDLLLQPTPGRPAPPLELFVRLDPPREWHLYLGGLGPAEFSALFERELRPLMALVTRVPPDLLNPNYWEPLSKDAENAVRDRLGGIVTRSAGDQVLLWRADRIAQGRLLRDGLDVPAELLSGYALKTSGDGLATLARAWDGRGRFEWAGLSGGPVTDSVLSIVHNDLLRMRLSLGEEVFLFARQADGLARIVFPRREPFRRALEAAVRGFVHAATGAGVGRMGTASVDRLAAEIDGVGLSADPSRDVVDSGRTVEVHGRTGRTPWGVSAARRSRGGDDRLLLYYDRMSGLWAAAT
jgi:hypothetical protein